MKNILLPTDFSENSWNAIKYAIRLFRYEPCRFYLLNTYMPVIYYTEYLLLSPASSEMHNPFGSISEKNLERLEQRIKKRFPSSGHHFEFISRLNVLTEEIKIQVKEKKIDLIIMGTKGATGAKEILFGSNTVQIINKIHCPVIAVPLGYSFTVPQAALFPTDLEIDFYKNPPRLLKEIGSKYSLGIHLLNVSEEQLSQFQEKQKRFLQIYFRDLPLRFHKAAGRSITETIDDFQEEIGSDLLVMINNKHSFLTSLLFRSVINEIGFHVKTPFLVLPAQKEDRHRQKIIKKSYSQESNDPI